MFSFSSNVSCFSFSVFSFACLREFSFMFHSKSSDACSDDSLDVTPDSHPNFVPDSVGSLPLATDYQEIAR